ncbi:MAG: hypothetical protein ACRYFZ_14340 [Janthinobacterium lividum]
MLTSSVNPHDLVRVQELPVAGTLTKPLSEAKVYDLLREHFPTASSSAESPG